MSRNIHIAVIDDGISEKLYDVGTLEYNLVVSEELKMSIRSGYDPCLPSHGTTCAAVIRKYMPDVCLGSIKILNDRFRKGIRVQLIKALEWCAANEVRLVNLSLGTIDYRDFEDMKKTVDIVCKKGLIIVAACNNRNIYTCPASLPPVIGVKCDRSGTLLEGEYTYNGFAPDGIDIVACGRHFITDLTGKGRNTPNCNSFATPLITAKAADIIRRFPGIGLNDIKRQLHTGAKAVFQGDKKQDGEECRLINDIDVPIIVFFDMTDGKGAVIMDALAGIFKGDGYNAIALSFSGTPEENMNCTILPGEYYKNRENIGKNLLNMIYSVYEPDIILVGIAAGKSANQDNMEQWKGFGEIDVGIFVIDRYTGEVGDMDGYDTDMSAKIILALNGSEETDIRNKIKKQDEPDKKEISLLYYTGKETVVELYKSLVHLFEKETE